MTGDNQIPIEFFHTVDALIASVLETYPDMANTQEFVLLLRQAAVFGLAASEKHPELTTTELFGQFSTQVRIAGAKSKVDALQGALKKSNQ